MEARRILRFGVFELDVQSGELRKQGVKVRLADQPFQILLLLLDRPDEVVSREELQKKLWPADTFVDFDHSLNTAVRKLREALIFRRSPPSSRLTKYVPFSDSAGACLLAISIRY